MVGKYALKVGGLSSPSKMPCYGWSIPAQSCITGSKLREVPGSVCSKCYARKGRYVFPNVQGALERRLAAYQANPAEWAVNMTHALQGETHFRWFDSGDIQSLEMLDWIVFIAKARPEVSFWLPTRERTLVLQWISKNGDFPPNLVVRLSLPMVGQLPHPGPSLLPVSAVSKVAGEVTCPASTQGGKCLDCRKCWSREDVVYAAH